MSNLSCGYCYGCGAELKTNALTCGKKECVYTVGERLKKRNRDKRFWEQQRMTDDQIRQVSLRILDGVNGKRTRENEA